MLDLLGTVPLPLACESVFSSIAGSLISSATIAIPVIAVVVTGGVLIWGGSLSKFGRRLMIAALIVSALVLIAQMATPTSCPDIPHCLV
jgi:type IV secretory pathway VirB2 component (pilin)